jgi:hypothetical protein
MIMFVTFITQTCRPAARSSRVNRGIVINLWPPFGDQKYCFLFLLLPRFTIMRQETGDTPRLRSLTRHYRVPIWAAKVSTHLARLAVHAEKLSTRRPSLMPTV